MKTLIAEKFSEAHLERLTKLGCEVTYNPTVKAEDLPKLTPGFKILIVRGKQVSGDAIKASSELSLIIRAGAGVNTIDVKTASARGVFVANCPGKNSIAVAELVFALLLGIDRRIPESVASLRAHKWNKKEFSKADGIFGKTLGIVGVGQIGREVITRAHAFGLKVIAWSRSFTGEEAKSLGVERCATVDDVFRRADIVSLHVALKPETKKLVTSELPRPHEARGAILINTARGEVSSIKTPSKPHSKPAAVLRRLLDVFDPEPAEGTADFADPILDLPTLCATHHIGASTEQAQDAIAEETIRIIEAFAKSGQVLNCVNIATRTPAKWQLAVRHYDRVGVLAHVMDQLRRADINIEEVQNKILEGALTACCWIQLDRDPGHDLVAAIAKGNPDIISAELRNLYG